MNCDQILNNKKDAINKCKSSYIAGKFCNTDVYVSKQNCKEYYEDLFVKI